MSGTIKQLEDALEEARDHKEAARKRFDEAWAEWVMARTRLAAAKIREAQEGIGKDIEKILLGEPK